MQPWKSTPCTVLSAAAPVSDVDETLPHTDGSRSSSGGRIAGTVIGAVVGSIALLVLCVYVISNYRVAKHKQQEQAMLKENLLEENAESSQ
jgi:hypothetical protein